MVKKWKKKNPKNENYDNCFQYALTVSLNHQNIKNHPEIISKIKPFINQYNWKDIDFPSYPYHLISSVLYGKNNILFLPYNTEEIRWYGYDGKSMSFQLYWLIKGLIFDIISGWFLMFWWFSETVKAYWKQLS